MLLIKLAILVLGMEMMMVTMVTLIMVGASVTGHHQTYTLAMHKYNMLMLASDVSVFCRTPITHTESLPRSCIRKKAQTPNAPVMAKETWHTAPAQAQHTRRSI